MQPRPYLFFNGNCRDALTAYGAIFGATPQIMEAGSMPSVVMDIPPGKEDWVMHGTVSIGDGILFASDNIMATSDPMAGCSVMMSTKTVEEAAAIFEKLSDGGEITMAFAPTFWAAGFGTCVDRFGVRWMIGTDEQTPDQG